MIMLNLQNGVWLGKEVEGEYSELMEDCVTYINEGIPVMLIAEEDDIPEDLPFVIVLDPDL